MMNNTEFEGLWYYQQLNLFKMPKSITAQQASLHWREVQSFIDQAANLELPSRKSLLAKIEELQEVSTNLANNYDSLAQEYHELRMKPDRDLDQCLVEIKELTEINQSLETQNLDFSKKVLSLRVELADLVEQLNKYRNRPDITLSFGDPDGVGVTVTPRVGCE